MPTSRLEIPKDPRSEIYFDRDQLVVGFRTRLTQPKKTMAVKVLRVVLQAFGHVIEDRFFTRGTMIRIGSGSRNTFRIPTHGLAKRHKFIKYDRSGNISLRINKHFDGVLQIADTLKNLSEFCSATKDEDIVTISLPAGSKGYVEHGNLLIYFEEIPDPEKVQPTPLLKNLSDPYFLKWLLVSIAFHLIFLLILKIMPVSTKEITLEELPDKFKKIIIEPKEYKPFEPKQKLATNIPKGDQGKEGEGEKAPGKEGKRGRGSPGGKTLSRAALQKKGVLEFFSRGKSSALDDLLGGGSTVLGNVDSAFGSGSYGLAGERAIRQGKGLKGTGTGGGGSPMSLGQGLGTKGRGGGAKGTGLADFGTGKADVSVSASIDQEEVYIMGNIPKSVIAKIINDHLGQIRFCYERQLVGNPNLGGKVVMSFIIGLEGNVTSTQVKQSTMMNPTVESCIAAVIRRMPFPKPGGGIVEVSYPFLFRKAG